MQPGPGRRKKSDELNEASHVNGCLFQHYRVSLDEVINVRIVALMTSSCYLWRQPL